eukprot:10618469-Alexandrium_andersonii.AAC.1
MSLHCIDPPCPLGKPASVARPASCPQSDLQSLRQHARTDKLGQECGKMGWKGKENSKDKDG